MKGLISSYVQNEIVRKLLIEEPEIIERCFQENMYFNKPMGSCLEAMTWIDKVGDRFKGFNREGQLQTIRTSDNGSILHGVFEIDGKWYRSSFRTGRLFCKLWGTDVGCLANIPEEAIDDLLTRVKATSYMHLKAEFSSVLRNEYHNNAFFSWKNSILYGCIQHRPINMSVPLIDSELRINRISKRNFFEFIQPYAIRAS